MSPLQRFDGQSGKGREAQKSVSSTGTGPHMPFLTFGLILHTAAMPCQGMYLSSAQASCCHPALAVIDLNAELYPHASSLCSSMVGCPAGRMSVVCPHSINSTAVRLRHPQHSGAACAVLRLVKLQHMMSEVRLGAPYFDLAAPHISDAPFLSSACSPSSATQKAMGSVYIQYQASLDVDVQNRCSWNESRCLQQDTVTAAQLGVHKVSHRLQGHSLHAAVMASVSHNSAEDGLVLLAFPTAQYSTASGRDTLSLLRGMYAC